MSIISAIADEKELTQLMFVLLDSRDHYICSCQIPKNAILIRKEYECTK